MMQPPPCFELAINWLLEVLRTPKNITAINLGIHEVQMEGPGSKCDIFVLPNWLRRFFGGVWSTSKSLLVADIKLGGGLFMIFCYIFMQGIVFVLIDTDKFVFRWTGLGGVNKWHSITSSDWGCRTKNHRGGGEQGQGQPGHKVGQQSAGPQNSHQSSYI